MSRKDYLAISATIRDQADLAQRAYDDTRVDALYCVACALADCLALDNKAFSRSRFITACGF